MALEQVYKLPLVLEPQPEGGYVITCPLIPNLITEGGYYLLKDPSEIKVVSIFRILEGPIAMVPCVSLNFYEKCDDCPDEDACSVHKLMIQVRDNTLQVLRNNTLADIT